MSAGGDEFVLVGRVVGSFGLRGDVKVAASAFTLVAGQHAIARIAGRPDRALVVRSVRPATGHVRVSFDGVDDADAAAELRGATLHVAARDMPPLPPDAYRESELVGMRVVDERLGDVGGVVGIAQYPSADMLVVGPKRVLIPMLAAYGLRVDRAARTITTKLPDGFEELL
ncbi:MAG TPA: ribosome maturation factor RimM [Candidatus Binatus sp.]|nr:ribosome maturation factor RimM [Candidatus Binatus sp.]